MALSVQGVNAVRAGAVSDRSTVSSRSNRGRGEFYRDRDNRLFVGDCLPVMRSLPAASIDLIYCDPPFFSGRHHRNSKFALRNANFSDVWEGGLPEYIAWLAERLREMPRLLTSNGSIYLHLDWHAVHYVKVEMDRIFGVENFRNEIIWHYGGRGAKAVATQFPRNHDTLLVYSKSPGAQVFHRQYIERALPAATARRRGYRRDAEGRWFTTAPRGDYTDASVRRLEARGRVHRTANGGIRIKYFIDGCDGHVTERLLVGDTWCDIPDAMHMPRAERLGYPTQKPEALLTRIIAASSNPGDTVADFFCGSGTTCAVAERLGRRWIGCDISREAVELTARRVSRLRDHDLSRRKRIS